MAARLNHIRRVPQRWCYQWKINKHSIINTDCLSHQLLELRFCKVPDYYCYEICPILIRCKLHEIYNDYIQGFFIVWVLLVTHFFEVVQGGCQQAAEVMIMVLGQDKGCTGCVSVNVSPVNCFAFCEGTPEPKMNKKSQDCFVILYPVKKRATRNISKYNWFSCGLSKKILFSKKKH